jgi:hypothetical protein
MQDNILRKEVLVRANFISLYILSFVLDIGSDMFDLKSLTCFFFSNYLSSFNFRILSLKTYGVVYCFETGVRKLLFSADCFKLSV